MADTTEAADRAWNAFLAWAGAEGYDTAHTFDTERSKWIALSAMTASLWKAWQASAGYAADAPESRPLRDQVIAARRTGFLEALSQGTHHAMWALLRRAMRQLDAWQKAYGAADPEWLPPAGDVQLMEDYAAFTSASTDTKSAPESGWRPIETAPKDGTEVLLWREDCGVMIGCYTSPDAFLSQQEIDRTCREHPEESDDWLFQEDWFGGSWQEGGWRLEGSEVPTHWMPLPPPPTFPDHKETT